MARWQCWLCRGAAMLPRLIYLSKPRTSLQGGDLGEVQVADAFTDSQILGFHFPDTWDQLV